MGLGTALVPSSEQREVVPLLPETGGGQPQSKPFIFPSPHVFNSSELLREQAVDRIDCSSLFHRWNPQREELVKSFLNHFPEERWKAWVLCVGSQGMLSSRLPGIPPV